MLGFERVKDYIFTIRFKRLVLRIKDSPKDYDNVALALKLLDSHYFKRYCFKYGLKITIDTGYSNFNGLIVELDNVIARVSNRDYINSFNSDTSRYVNTLNDFLVDDSDKVINLGDAIGTLVSSYLLLYKTILEVETLNKREYYKRRLQYINKDVIEILKALAIFKINT